MGLKLKIVDLEGLTKKLAEWRKGGQKIVFTNGCFDLLHQGHVEYLEKSKNRGERLVVGLNSDDSVRRLKGKDRPVLNQQARSAVLAALESVDAVIIFDQDTPHNLIQQVIPDILIKGGDYDIKDIVGADIVKKNGGKVETIPMTEGYSTSGIINKIKRIK
jgi:rfaE bifunctional protein nucleotidyltransferase chain/domain